MNEEFKLRFYYNLYKNYPVVCRENFRNYFISKHGEFKYFNELALMIEKYQHKIFGESLYNKIDFNESKRRKRR